MASCLLGCLSLLFLPKNPYPLGWHMCLCMACFGLASIGTMVTSVGILAQASQEESRGALAGGYSFAGALGLLQTSGFGGYLIDRFGDGRVGFRLVAALFAWLAVQAFITSSNAKGK